MKTIEEKIVEAMANNDKEFLNYIVEETGNSDAIKSLKEIRKRFLRAMNSVENVHNQKGVDVGKLYETAEDLMFVFSRTIDFVFSNLLFVSIIADENKEMLVAQKTRDYYLDTVNHHYVKTISTIIGEGVEGAFVSGLRNKMKSGQ